MRNFVLTTKSQCKEQYKVAVEQIASCLKKGGIILVPTDTVYGLAVSPLLPTSVKNIFTMKNRPLKTSLPLVVADVEQLEQLGLVVNNQAQLCLNSVYMPGALSLVLSVRKKKAPTWLQHRNEVAIRIPNHCFLRCLIRQSGPLYMTSANRHGYDTPNNVKDILSQLAFPPDYIVEAGSINSIPSTIVNCTDNYARTERIGVVSNEEIERILYDKI